MRLVTGFLLLLVVPPVAAQSSVSRAVLAPLPVRTGECRPGADRMVTLHVDETPARALSAATNSTGAVVRFAAVASTTAGTDRREVESVTVTFGDDERLREGERRYQATGAAGVLDDRRGPLDGADALAALYLAKQVLARCAAVGR